VPATNIQAIFQGILIATDNSQSPAPYVANIDLQNPTLTGLKFYYDAFFQALSSGSNVPIGVGGSGAEAFLILVINRAPGSNLQVNVTPTGGTSQEVGVFGPGGVCLLMDSTETGVGWIALTLTAIGSTCPVTVFTAI
jgi:hypothetical protein